MGAGHGDAQGDLPCHASAALRQRRCHLTGGKPRTRVLRSTQWKRECSPLSPGGHPAKVAVSRLHHCGAGDR
ncbi:unnamed protein product, partial [Effrenium voratum]